MSLGYKCGAGGSASNWLSRGWLVHGCWTEPQVLLGTLLQQGDWGQFLGDLHTVTTVEDAELEGTSDKPQPQCFPGSILPPLEDVIHHCHPLLSKF